MHAAALRRRAELSRRKLLDKLFVIVGLVILFAALAVLVVLFADLLRQGAPRLNLEFLSQFPSIAGSPDMALADPGDLQTFQQCKLDLRERDRHATTLADFRDRYALHKSDPALQAAHAACPWAVTWDDHEVQNDYAAGAGQARGEDAQSFLTLRSAAWQAFYENMPLRAASLNRTLPDTRWDALQVYRRLRWGRQCQCRTDCGKQAELR